MVSRMGLTETSQEKVTYWNEGNVRISASCRGWKYVRIWPRDTVYQYATGLAGVLRRLLAPPSRWDNGIPGLLLDYNINGQ